MLPILISDSGLGGLSVLRELRVLLPEYSFVYAADMAAFPYGEWEEADLTRHITSFHAALIARYQPTLIVVACNTASTVALDILRREFPQQRFVGTVPAIKPAAERTRSRLISVLATPGTVNRDYTHELIQSFAARCQVNLVASHRLAALAEAFLRGEFIDERAVKQEILPCFVEHDGNRTDIIVLGCTHYPFLANLFRKLAPWPVDWLDPAEAIARRAASLVETRADRISDYDNLDIAIISGSAPSFSVRRLFHGFGVTRIDLLTTEAMSSERYS